MTQINTLVQDKQYTVSIPGTCQLIKALYVRTFRGKVIFKTLDFEAPKDSHPGLRSYYGNIELCEDRTPENYIH